MTASPPPAAPTAGVGQSLIGHLEENAARERTLDQAYVVTLKGSGEERVHWDDAPPDRLFAKTPERVWGRPFVRFADGSLVDPAEVADIRPISPEEAAERLRAEMVRDLGRDYPAIRQILLGVYGGG